MNIEKLRKELTIDEGCIDKIYLDHLGYPTLGIGHLITKDDPEYGLPVDYSISQERIEECFGDDIEGVLTDLDRNISWWVGLCEDHQRVLANMAFNLGINRLLNFKKFLAALQEHDFETAAVEMMDSKWATQVGPRATRLRDRILKGNEDV
jgi:lysozyme|tara:strand:+ start:2841 stop:3293 length:453 start_codon:yes stop_codon:yes gene_type:complete